MKYFIQIFGCQMNRSDAERIVSLFESLGFTATTPKDADLVVAVMCSVRQMAAERVFGMDQKLKLLKKNNPKLISILTGCVVSSDKKRFAKIFDHILDIKTLGEWPKILGLSKKSVGKNDYFNILPKNTSLFSALIPISKGCDNYCTYCVVPYTRGPLKSRTVTDILKEVRSAIKSGAKEIWLLGQNVNNYHFAGTDFAQLLRRVNDIEGDFWIRFTSPHPKDFTDEAVESMAECHKVTPYLNLPIQSGDNAILKAMARPYTVAAYRSLVNKIRQAFWRQRRGLERDVAISTDVIVGFPGETKKQFQNTAKIFKEIKYDMAYIAQYSRRGGTAAARLDDNVTPKEKKRREETINRILKRTALASNKKFVDQTVAVLVDSAKCGIFGIGKSRHYKTVKFPIGPSVSKDLIGKFVEVKITKAQSFGLVGRLVKDGK